MHHRRSFAPRGETAHSSKPKKVLGTTTSASTQTRVVSGPKSPSVLRSAKTCPLPPPDLPESCTVPLGTRASAPLFLRFRCAWPWPGPGKERRGGTDSQRRGFWQGGAEALAAPPAAGPDAAPAAFCAQVEGGTAGQPIRIGRPGIAMGIALWTGGVRLIPILRRTLPSNMLLS